MPTVFYKTQVRLSYLACKRYLLHAKIKQKPDNHVRRYGMFLTGHVMPMRSVHSYRTSYPEQRELPGIGFASKTYMHSVLYEH